MEPVKQHEIPNQYRTGECGERLCRRDIRHGSGLSDVQSRIKPDRDKAKPGWTEVRVSGISAGQ